MKLEEFRKSYWDFYLELEKRMEETHRYIEYDENNFKTYSSYYLMLFQNVCSEIDVVGKEIASHFNPAIDNENGTKPINRWWFEIQDNLSDINRQVIFSDSFHVRKGIENGSNARYNKIVSSADCRFQSQGGNFK